MNVAVPYKAVMVIAQISNLRIKKGFNILLSNFFLSKKNFHFKTLLKIRIYLKNKYYLHVTLGSLLNGIRL